MIYLIDMISLIDMIDKKKQHQIQNLFSDIMKMMFYSVYILSKSI